MDSKEHFAHLLSLLKTERAEDRKQYESKIRNRSVHERRKDGVTWFPVTIDKSYLSTGERWVLQVTRTQGLAVRHMFQVGASVSLFLNEETIKHSINGVVSRITEHSMRIVLNIDYPPDWLAEGKVGVDLLFDESTYDEMEKTMGALQSADSGRIAELIPVVLGLKEPVFEEVIDREVFGLNESQNAAIRHMESAKDLALIHGPPGTGKTTTLVQGIKLTLESEEQVLVCASSNAAVDLMVEKLHHEQVKVLRLGHPGRVDDEVLVHTLDVQLSQHPDAKMLRELRQKSGELKKLAGKFKRNFGRSERQQRKEMLQEAKKLREDAHLLESHMIFQVISQAEVIACTLVGANNDYLRNRTFGTVFIDEASQALEPANWIPIMKAKRVVLAGDHRQLTPTVKSKVAGQKGLSKTIFERVMESCPNFEMLQVQYRMHPDIASFSNQYFYQGLIRSGESVNQRLQLFNEPSRFIDTAGCGFQEDINPETLSTFNEEQAHFTLSYLDRLMVENDKMQQCSIGLIAPYKAHIDILKRNIKRYDWFGNLGDSMSINSVDAFQGQERDVILLDLVRSNAKGEIGFLADIRRTNVAMTRARHLLIVIGDSATLSSSSFYNDLVQNFQESNCYHSAFEYIYQ